MGDILFHFREILSNGQGIHGDYQLICHGKAVGEKLVKVYSEFQFHHALQSIALSSNSSSFVPITPLKEWNSLKIEIHHENLENHLNIKLVVDLVEKSVSFETRESISPHLLSGLLSCFGIKKGKQILYFTSQVPIKKRRKLKK
ncbi:hypothetical protein [Heyndrickxia sporothermodurans]|uniref:Uncharacterized protein n=1 Tax=Heyndrickxia sporothermodurans TaxID=46224 RepID=A0A150LA17_9BACI|nr:hypothetical protein [Heyndrickxia sporothermodurans]KYD09115.1 hypothetical protein B4102_2642 [Heyndrickxia sporothermodurans]MED3650688.1 hypothetical protein [Heyndrickxia sporothermodurans]MED3653652.1 hypothetical protein [Heyndrickxia sporothermodurans]MED3697452.1 hypothetical protein [Heyndrickxia sporothermodurans]MED3780475.1 hypothetical protein [Heyndrickxia sporothermodurans]